MQVNNNFFVQYDENWLSQFCNKVLQYAPVIFFYVAQICPTSYE